MHHTISYQLAQAHIADLRERAQRNTLARAARRVRPGRVAARHALERASASLVALPSGMVVAVCRDR